MDTVDSADSTGDGEGGTGAGPKPTSGDGGGRPAAEDTSGTEEAKDPLRFSNWMKRSATGAVMTGIAVGLREALQPQKREVPFVIEGRTDPDDPDGPIDLRFDPDSPADTVAFIRLPVAVDDPETSPPPS